MQQRSIEYVVGLFLLAGFAALLVLALKVSGLSGFFPNGETYTVTANFDNVGDLKVRAPVTVAGVKVGEVSAIALDGKTFQGKVTLRLDKRYTIPADTSASIFTQGLLGGNYISLTPGFDTTNLHTGDSLTDTHPALILENLIGQLLFNMNSDKEKKGSES